MEKVSKKAQSIEALREVARSSVVWYDHGMERIAADDRYVMRHIKDWKG